MREYMRLCDNSGYTASAWLGSPPVQLNNVQFRGGPDLREVNLDFTGSSCNKIFW